MSTTTRTAAVFPNDSSAQNNPEADSTSRSRASHALIADLARETGEAPAEYTAVQNMQCDGLKDGYFGASLSCNDPSTPFWVGKTAGFLECEGGTTTQELPELIRVHWYQASGSARDPFDAAYTPARRPESLGGHGGNSPFWVSVIGRTDVVTSFPNLTRESRLEKETVVKIKNILYK